MWTTSVEKDLDENQWLGLDNFRSKIFFAFGKRIQTLEIYLKKIISGVTIYFVITPSRT